MEYQIPKMLAMQHFHEGRYLFEAYSKPVNAIAIGHFKAAAALDSTFAAAHCWHAYALLEDYRQNWTDDRTNTFNTALGIAKKAANDAPKNYYTHWTLASVKMQSETSGDFESAWDDYEEAKRLMEDNIDPAFLAERAEYLSCKGEPDRAIEDIVAAKALVASAAEYSNRKAPDWYDMELAFAYYLKEDFATASGLLQTVSNIGIPNIGYILLAVCEAHIGRRIPPEDVIGRLRLKDPGWTPEKIERIAFQRPKDIADWEGGLVEAGLKKRSG
jgi:tetratricopeptide (TPR) repeat protein